MSFPWRSWKVSLTDGTVLFDLPLARVADNDGWRIRWSELYRVLRQAAAPVIAYGCTITRVAPSEGKAGRTSIAWTDASGAERRLDEVDLLVAADGRYSEVRWRCPARRPCAMSAWRSRACWCRIPAAG